uniref:uncharacterized protein LOC122604369 n=1 Tax=Erigeron canadensis TaxID=72917 RepID=UPI001CB97D84|nr:uncharacterized protein LOC122604369 [Erigeron canadensis]
MIVDSNGIVINLKNKPLVREPHLYTLIDSTNPKGLIQRLQLIGSVLSSMHVHWASMFILPARVIKDLEKLMRAFLWCQGPLGKGKAKVSWKSICLPKNEGGLGIKQILVVNKSLMAKHIWSIITNRESLWVKWVHSYRLQGWSFWDVPIKSGCSWGWRKLLNLRSELRQFIRSKIGDGASTSAWDANWIWSVAWYTLFPVLISIPVISLSSVQKDYKEQKESVFSTTIVWDSFRDLRPVVHWAALVWYSQCIPRHAFLLWLVLARKLKTQDKMLSWDKSGNMNLRLLCCSLCKRGPDSHEHLFFDCDFSKQERNKRLFTNETRSIEVMVKFITSTVRMRLATLRFKRTHQVERILKEWQLPWESLLMQKDGHVG